MTKTQCAACGAAEACSRCGRCRSVRYCNSACQSKDWAVHRRICTQLRVSPDESRAAPDAINTDLTGKLLREAPHQIGRKPPPSAELFPSGFRHFQYQSSADGVDENLLLLLHGLGDTHTSFAGLAKRLSLPQTATLALSAPIKFPEVIAHGRSWFTSHDQSWDLIQPSAGERRRVDSLYQTRTGLKKVVDALCTSCDWKQDRIHLFGFSQGGTVVLDFALNHCGVNHVSSVVAISASLLPELFLQEGDQQSDSVCEGNCPSVLITHGSKDEVVLRADVERTVSFLRSRHKHMQVTLSDVNKGHAMINSAEEMHDVMALWAGKLHRRLISMESNSSLFEVTQA